MTTPRLHLDHSIHAGELAQAQDVMIRAWIRTTYDALLVFEAARRGVVPRVTRRFHDAEKRSIIVSGAVLVFTEEESGIKRWTDPFMWSASRMLGNFMIYREREDIVETPISPYSRSVIGASISDTKLIEDPELERCIYGSWNRGRGLKAHGLMKKTISFPINGIVYHLVSYYKPAEVLSGLLRTPSVLEPLSSLVLSDEVLRNISRFRHPPRMDIDPSGRAVYIGEEENLSMLYSARASPSPVPRILSLPTPSLTEVPLHSHPEPALVQPVLHRAVQQSPDTVPVKSGVARLDATLYTTDNRVQYIAGSSDCSHTSRTVSASYNPYLRPHEATHPRYKERRLCSLKHAPSASLMACSNDHDQASADIPHFPEPLVQAFVPPYDPSLSSLPTLLGGAQAFDRTLFHPEARPDHQPDIAPMEELWNAMGGSADWIYHPHFFSQSDDQL